jgi:hypothetical protein
VARVSGYRSRGPGSIPGAVDLELGPLSLVSTTEELLGKKKKSEITVIGIRHADHMAPSISKRWH